MLQFLVVDDSRLDREFCELLLKESQPEGTQIHFANGCKDALQVIEKDDVFLDCVLLDCNMPDGKGADIIKNIHEAYPKASVIMLTVENDLETAKKCLQLGADDYLIKGEYNAHLLSRSIEYAIERRRTKLKEHELSIALETERKLNEIQKEFICLVAHEFRTPLGIISSATQLLRAKANTEDALHTRQYAKIDKAINRLSGLMDNVLLLHRLETGTVLGVAENIKLVDLVEKMIDQFRNDAPDCRIRLNVEEEDLTIQGGGQLCEYCLHNLIENAIKYSPKESEITVSIKKDGEFADIFVQDQGSGIDEETMGKIGTRFVRGQDTLDQSGIGLGLFLALQFSHHSGGALYICSSKGEGTSVKLKWPLAENMTGAINASFQALAS